MSDKTLYQRDYFPFLRSFKDAINSLPDPDKLIVYEAITDYAFFQIEPNIESPMAKLCWVLIKPILEKQWNKVNAGSKGGAPIGNTNASKQSSLSLSNKQNSSKKQAEFKHQEHIGERIKEIDKDKEDGLYSIENKYPFDSFWNLYDKKVNRPRCEAKWDKLSEETKKIIMESLPRYIEATSDKQYRKNPLTYLNNEGWNDEIIKSNQRQSPSKDVRRGTDVSASSGSEYEGDF